MSQKQVRTKVNNSSNHSDNRRSSVTPQIEKTILRGKRTELQGNNARSLVRFELDEGNTRTVVIAEDIVWRRREDGQGNRAVGRYKVVTQYVMDITNEPKK
jgi:hypothetical protein